MKPASPQSFWRTGQQGSWDWLCTQPPSRPQARWRCVSISGSGGKPPALPAQGRVQGGTLPLPAQGRVQGGTLPPAAEANSAASF